MHWPLLLVTRFDPCAFAPWLFYRPHIGTRPILHDIPYKQANQSIPPVFRLGPHMSPIARKSGGMSLILISIDGSISQGHGD